MTALRDSRIFISFQSLFSDPRLDFDHGLQNIIDSGNPYDKLGNISKDLEKKPAIQKGIAFQEYVLRQRRQFGLQYT
jgi:hypothetical protein